MARLSGKSSVSGNYSDSSKSSVAESVVVVQVDSESDNSPHDHKPSTLPLFDGSNKTVLEALAGYFYWFSTLSSVIDTKMTRVPTDYNGSGAGSFCVNQGRTC